MRNLVVVPRELESFFAGQARRVWEGLGQFFSFEIFDPDIGRLNHHHHLHAPGGTLVTQPQDHQHPSIDNVQHDPSVALMIVN